MLFAYDYYSVCFLEYNRKYLQSKKKKIIIFPFEIQIFSSPSLFSLSHEKQHQWTLRPEYVYEKIWRARIKGFEFGGASDASTKCSESDFDFNENLLETFAQERIEALLPHPPARLKVTRSLIPRNYYAESVFVGSAEKSGGDQPLSQNADTFPVQEEILHDYSGGKVVYSPILVFKHADPCFQSQVRSSQDLPFFYPKVSSYCIEFIPSASSSSSGLLVLSAVYFSERVFPEMLRIGSVLLRKLHSWAANRDTYVKRACHDVLIPRDAFLSTYHGLKLKYSRWIADWQEKTDPIKFVFEDIGIAAFLIAYWEKIGAGRSVNFVDLGAGNGFLVYILISEGYRGVGIDLRKRRVWDKYPESVRLCLQEQAIRPDEASFPDADWLIGNHPDELTPWIPIIAARSSRRTNYFIIPCCYFDFDCRFNSFTDPLLGKYKFYLNFIENIGHECDFNVETDELRIPSTKNHAILGTRKNQMSSEQVETKIAALKERSHYKGFVPKKDEREGGAHSCHRENNKDRKQKKALDTNGT